MALTPRSLSQIGHKQQPSQCESDHALVLQLLIAFTGRPTNSFAYRLVLPQPIFYNVQSAVPYLPTSGNVGVLAAWRRLIELPE
jgi:hypothetical protein